MWQRVNKGTPVHIRLLTDFFSSLRAQSGIQGVSMGQRSVAFVLTLFTFYKKATIQSILLIYNTIYKVTWNRWDIPDPQARNF